MFLASEVEVILDTSNASMFEIQYASSSNLYSVQALLLIPLQRPALSQVTLKLSNKQLPYAVTVFVVQNY